MTTSDRHRAFWPTCCFLLAGLAGAGCDLQTKAWAEESLGGVEGGSVVDFVKVNFPWGGSWPAFNVADALLVIGPAAFLLLRWRRARRLAA